MWVRVRVCVRSFALARIRTYRFRIFSIHPFPGFYCNSGPFVQVYFGANMNKRAKVIICILSVTQTGIFHKFGTLLQMSQWNDLTATQHYSLYWYNGTQNRYSLQNRLCRSFVDLNLTLSAYLHQLQASIFFYLSHWLYRKSTVCNRYTWFQWHQTSFEYLFKMFA